MTNDALWPRRLDREEVILAAVKADVICLHLCCNGWHQFSPQQAHTHIVFYLSFHNTMKAYIKKALLAMEAAAVILLADTGCRSRQSASMRTNESVEALYQDASHLWH